ncbi:PAS domain S-box protein [Chitinibacter tainanensis]|uniref:PAS domain S-box protein n=1 Tax=Chitinibacter tainanensis TaxID=230667 RepID=UPI00048CA297|nr:PAS domain S-box protein [Chitinibacter tainanensis]
MSASSDPMLNTVSAAPLCSAALLRLLGQVSGMVYRCRLDSERTVDFAAEAALRLTGYPASTLCQELPGGWLSLIHPEDRPTFGQQSLDRLQTQQGYQLEYRLVRSDGATVWVQDQGYGIYDEAGQLIGIEALVLDIAARKEREQHLLSHQHHLQALYDQSPDLLLTIDWQQQIILDCNQTLLNTLGYYKHEIIGQNWLQLYTPESAALFTESWQALLLSKQELQDVALDLRSKQQRVINVLLHAHFVTPEQETTPVLSVTWRDISKLKNTLHELARSEQRLGALLESSAVPTMICSGLRGINYLNPAFIELFGYSSVDLIDLTQWWQQAFPDPHYRTHVEQEWNQRIQQAQQGQSVFSRFVAHVCAKNGQYKSVALHCAPLEDDWQDEIVLTFTDLGAQLAQQNELVERELRYRSLFDAAHLSIWHEDMSELVAMLDELRLSGISDIDAYLRDKPEAIYSLLSGMKVTDVNPATLILFETSKEALLQGFSQLFGEGALDVAREEIRAFWRKEERFRSEVNLITATGKPFKAILAFPIPANVTTAKYVPVTVQDLSNPLELKNELALHAEIVENLQQAVHLISARDGRVVYANPTAEAMFGFAAEEMLGVSVTELIASDESASPHNSQRLLQLLQEQGHWEGELLNLRKDGSQFWSRLSSSSFEHMHYGPVWVSVQRDITEERHAREELDLRNLQLNAIVDIQGDFISSQNERQAFNLILLELQRLSQSGFTLIAEVLGQGEQRQLKINAIRHQLWDAATVALFEQNISSGWEFDCALCPSAAEVVQEGMAKFLPHIPALLGKTGEQLGLPALGASWLIPIHYGNRVNGLVILGDLPAGGLQVLATLEPLLLTYSQLLTAMQSKREFRRANEALFQRDQLWKAAIEGSGHGVWDWDLRNQQMTFTETWANLLGLHINELANTFSEWEQRLHPDDRRQALEQLNDYLQGRSQAYASEYRLRGKAGQYVWILGRGTIVQRDEQGQPLRMIGTSTDITQRKATEEQLLANRAQLAGMIDGAMDAIVTTDTEFNIILFNRAAEQMFGFPASQILGCPIEALIPVRHTLTHREYMHQFAREGDHTRKMRSYNVRQVHGRRANGEEFPVEVSISYSDNYGNPIYTAMVRDITERIEHEHNMVELNVKLEERVIERTRELDAARHLAESANRAKSAFVANMSHEIRTPLNSVLGMAHLALQTELNPKQRDYLQKITASGQHLLGLINDILDFSKIEAGKLEIEHCPFNLADMLAEIRDIMEPRASEKHLAFDLFHDQLELRTVEGDALRLKQVLLNLLSNAIKFTEHGRVSLCLASDPAEPERLEFKVCDTGIGIPQHAQQRLFEPFDQADSSTTRKYGGTGLGLAISRQLVGLMGGELKLRSQLHLGSEFSFAIRLPISAEQLPASTTHGSAQQTLPKLAGKRVLLADDHPFNQQVGADLLSQVGIQVVIANDGREAVRLAEAELFDAILLDIQMPEMDGYTACKILRQNPRFKDLPIIAMTANVSTEDRQLCREAGMNDFLGKPVQPDKLYQTLMYWLQSNTVTDLPSYTPSPTDRHPLFDPTVLNVMFGADPQRQHKYLQKFADTLREGLANLAPELAASNLHKISSECHRLKSVARTVGAMALGERLADLETHQTTLPLDVMREKIAELQRLFTQTCAHLQTQGLLAASCEAEPQLSIHNIDPELRVMLLDDDVFMLDLLAQHLQDLGLVHITRCLDAHAALAQLEQMETPDWILCDLQMPDMDGIAFLRQLGQQAFTGQVAILSGLDDNVLKATEKLAHSFRLNIHGALSKPIRKEDLARLLSESAQLQPRLQHAAGSQTMQLERSELEWGLAHGAIELFYQPKVSTRTHTVVGAECLARWRHPQRGLLGPYTFVPALEQHGLVDELTFQVLRLAVSQLRQWQAAGMQIKLSVNVSMDNLHRLELPELFCQVLDDNDIAPESITLEITETQLSHDYVLSLDILTRLRIKGFGLSIDDFGTGFSTMEHLMQTPFTELKIDRAFVRGASQDQSARTILEHSVTLGSKFNLNLVAEGVETQEDWDLVVSAGCHEVQGYLVAEPMAAADFLVWKQNWEAHH